MAIGIVLLGISTQSIFKLQLKAELNFIKDNKELSSYIIKVSNILKSPLGYKISAEIISTNGFHDKQFKNKIGVDIYASEVGPFIKNKKYICTLNLKGIKVNKNPETINYKRIFELKNIYFTTNISTKNLNTIKGINSKNNISEFFDELQKIFVENIFGKIKSHRNASIITALVLGDKSNLVKATKDIFKNTGSIHVLAVSGLHVGLIYSILLFVLYWLPRNRYINVFNLFLSILFIFSYCLLTGAGTSVVRASAMLSLYLIGKHYGLFTSIYNIIAFVAFLILLHTPNALYTISFQFSFLALIGIIFFNVYFDFTSDKSQKIIRYFSQLITVSFAAQILIMPLLIYYFNQFSIYFWLSGLIAIPMAFIVLLSTLAMLLSHFLGLDIFSDLLAKVLHFSTDFLFNSMTFISELPHCSISKIYISKVDVICIYICLILIMIFLKYKYKWVIYPMILSLFMSGSYKYFKKVNSWKKSELIVYHLFEKSLITYTHNGIITDVLNRKISNVDYNNLLFKFKNKYHIKTRETINTINFEKAIIKIEDKKIGLDTPKSIINSQNQIDILILTKAFNNNSDYFNNTNIHMVVLDGSINFYSKKEIIKQLSQMQIDYHDTQQSGAFIYKTKL